MKSRTLLASIIVSAVALGLVAVSCNDTTNDPIPGPFPIVDATTSPYDGGFVPNDGGYYQDAPTQPTSDAAF